LHLGTSTSAPPTTDGLNLKIATPALNALSSLRQTNTITIPAGTPSGTYYLWVVADDVANGGLNQTSKLDDAVHSEPLLVSLVALNLPASGATVSAPPLFSWSATGIPIATVYLAKNAAPILGTDTVLFLDTAARTSELQLSVTNWTAAVNALGYAPDYYWTIGSANAALRQVYAEWRPFKARPLVIGGNIVAGLAGNFRLEVLAPNDAQLTVQGTENLVNWIDLESVQNTTGTTTFTDVSAADGPTRFYRAKR
jgi:hypothetical protein